MNLKVYGEELYRRYDMAKRNEAVLQIYLYVIEHATELKEAGISAKQLAENAQLEGYVAEISKALKLSDYVQLKQFYQERLKR